MDKCRLCGNEEFDEYFVIDKSNIIYKCSEEECNLIQLPNNSEVQLNDESNDNSIKQDKYRKTSNKDMEMNSNVDLPDIMKNLAHVIQEDTRRISGVVESLIPPDKEIKFIDVGSGYGHIGFNIGNNNPNVDVHLLETSKERMDMGKKSFNQDRTFTFHHRLLDSLFAEEYNEHFDIVLSFHVLEHVNNVVDFIKNMYDITKKDGLIVIEVPNEDDDLQEFSDSYKKLIHFPSHISYFTKKTLQVLLDKANITDNSDVEFIGVQRYGFFNWIDWIRHDNKDMVISDDYIPRDKPSWIEEMWLRYKKLQYGKNLTTDSIMMIIKK
jgi:2-polyprenyl-3-methyl-5-hydroxy-6-metoxy-1,4-benzoquinol methylase